MSAVGADISGKVNDVIDEARPVLHRIADRVSDTAQELAQKGKDAAHEAQEQLEIGAQRVRENAEHYVQNAPLKSLLLAAGTGAAVALALLLKLLVLPPELLKVHAQGYADLASQAWADHLCALKNRWVMYALSALNLLLALILGGVALLLWSALPLNDAPHAWRLAVSRARLVEALRDPAWLILVQRWLQAKARAASHQPPAERNSGPALAQAQDDTTNTGVYVGIGAGESKGHFDSRRKAREFGASTNNMTEDHRGASYKAFVGFPLSPFWAVEAGYFDLGRFGYSGSPVGSASALSRTNGLNLDLVGTLPITDRWSLLGRVGAAYAETKDSYSNGSSQKNRDTHYKFGFGTQYAFTPAVTLRVEGERYRIDKILGNRADVDVLSLSLVYRFGGSTPATKTAYTPYVPPAPEPVVAQAPVPWVKVKLEADSLFGFDQDSLQSDGKQALDKLLQELKTVNVEAIQITGHSDRLGSKAYNQKLSTKRAEAVKNYLVQIGGIPDNKVTATGVGSSQPDTQPGDCKGSKPTQALITCLRVDRRVEVEVSGSQQQR
eukprot:gene6242-6102_t